MDHRIRLEPGAPVPDGVVKVDASTMWGNPYHGQDSPGKAVLRYREWLGGDGPATKTLAGFQYDRERQRDALATLAGKSLACTCPLGAPCHADVLAEMAGTSTKDTGAHGQEQGGTVTPVQPPADVSAPPADAGTVTLPGDEARQLADCEAVIERGLKTFVEVGRALMQVRDARLYRAVHGTFEEYAEQRWGLIARRAYQLIDAAAVDGSLRTNVHKDQPLPANEAQARELAPLLDDPEELRDTWEEANRRTDGKPTAAAVRGVRKERQGRAPGRPSMPKPKPAEPELFADADEPAPNPAPAPSQGLDGKVYPARRQPPAVPPLNEDDVGETSAIPPLTGGETSMTGSDIALRAALPEPDPPLDRRPEVVAQGRLMSDMGALAKRIQQADPVISQDVFRDANVYSARDVARRLVDSATVWLRTMNALYATGRDESPE
jgi:hypothetical protein